MFFAKVFETFCLQIFTCFHLNGYQLIVFVLNNKIKLISSVFKRIVAER